MSLKVAIGQAQALDGREAGLQAAHQALNQLGSGIPFLGIVIASYQYEARQVVAGITSLVSDLPLVGFSSPSGLTKDGEQPHSVILALFSGSNCEAEADWFPGYAQSSRETAARLMQIVNENRKSAQAVLFFADGFNGDAEQFCAALVDDQVRLIGGLSSGDLHTGNTYQLTNLQSGSGGLAAAVLKGEINVGVGYAHGWNPVGTQFRVTRSRGFWLRTLDGRPASETYAQLFGYPAREWAFPPLSYLVRLYPLGIDRGEDLLVRSPLRVEADGSFRMNAPIGDGVDAYLLVASPASCREAAQQAARQALLGLGDSKPALILMLVDVGWQMLLKGQSGLEVQAVREIVGENVPIAGGYTLGQIVPGPGLASPQFLNQHILVLAFGEAKEKE
jgi:hypothetical protein